MRPAVIVGSTAAHLVVLWLIADESVQARRVAAPPRRVAVTQSNASLPIEVDFVPAVGATTGTAASTPRTRSASGRAGAHRATRLGAATATGADASSGAPSSSGSSLMRMHRAEGRADLRLDPAAAERIASAAPAGPRDELHRSGRLESQPGGRAVIHDTVTTADVDASGDVTFHDKPDLDVKARSPMGAVLDPEFRREVRVHIAKWLEDPYEGTRYGASQDLPRHLQAVPQACDAWGSDWCQDPMAPDFEKRLRSIKQQLAGGVSGTFDITAYVQRKVGGDPYASRKLKLLDETRDERIEMRRRYHAQQDARSAELVLRNLERLWADELDPRARREALFALWDECTEDEPGKRARAIVIGWIRARLPRGSAHAFTDDELARLRARSTSAEPFVPYE